MKVTIVYAKQSVKFLQTLDKSIRNKVLIKIKSNIANGNPLQNAKELTGQLKGLYRYRIGKYRIIFDYAPGKELSILTILKIGHRKDIYK